MALLEARPYRPFKSSEEYLEAMKEDLAEWLSTMYPELMINAENFMDRLDTGVALCKHANYVRQAAEDYLARRQARNKSMTRSMTSGLAGPILAMGTVHYLPAAKSGTFFARDNVSNFITWCRKSLKIIECLLFETDDLIMRKNEKHVILCLLEVARRGAKFGMLAPMLVQMERQIDREIAADNKANGIGCGTQTDGADGHSNNSGKSDVGVGTGDDANALNGGCGIGVGVGVGGDGGGDDEDDDDDMFDSDSENGDGDDDGPMLVYGPQPQIITNDLKSLDEMVRDLVEKCTCPSQFPMVRVSEGKYRIGDTKVLIFVRILRSHVMVRVGGGWDTLAHYLDKHDPCRCRAQHRASVAARLVPRAGPQTNGIELHKAQVIFERSPPAARKAVSAFNGSASPSHASPATATAAPSTPPSASGGLSPTTYGGPKTRSRSPTPQRKFLSQLNADVAAGAGAGTERSLLPAPSSTLASPGLARRSMSPSPRRLIDMRKKQASLDSACGPKSLPLEAGAFDSLDGGVAGSSSTASVGAGNGSGLGLGIGLDPSTNGSNKFENISDNGSEISDEGYRSLGVIQSSGGAQKRESLHSQASMEDAESNARLDPTSSSDSQLSPADDSALSTNTTTTTTTTTKTPDNTLDTNLEHALDNNLELTLDNNLEHALDADADADDFNEAGPQSLPAVLFAAAATTRTPPSTPTGSGNRFEQSGIFITDDEITVDVALTNPKTNLGRGRRDVDERSTPQSRKATNEGATKIPRTPLATTAIGTATRTRRRSLDNSGSGCSGSLQDLPSRTGLPVFSRKKPVYRSVRRPHEPAQDRVDAMASMAPTASPRRSPAPHSGVATPPVRDVTNTWSGRTAASGKKQRPTIGADTFAPPTAGVAAFERNSKTRSSQVLYDSNGRRVRGGAGSGSLTTSPVKSQATSPLAQQLLEAASSAKNDAQILEKMKTLLSRYATTNATTSAPKASPNPAATATAMSKKPVYEDFTTAWVHSNGTLERSSSCSPPTKARSKRSSAASSVDSTHSRDNLGGAPSVVSPRRERGLSRIPGPIRQHTELY